MNQLEKDIAYCIDYLDLSNEQIGEMLRCIERLGISSVEHFCEEFVFVCEDGDGDEDIDQLHRIHDDSYLNIADFNSLYWEGN
tara:strand:+ start:2120 stop:2368 length:249 start_codon:yes stop_codon:yes gene_type:complete